MCDAHGDPQFVELSQLLASGACASCHGLQRCMDFHTSVAQFGPMTWRNFVFFYKMEPLLLGFVFFFYFPFSVLGLLLFIYFLRHVMDSACSFWAFMIGSLIQLCYNCGGEL